jgi:two-component system response regulator GlrR
VGCPATIFSAGNEPRSGSTEAHEYRSVHTLRERMPWRILVLAGGGLPFDRDDLPSGCDVEHVDWSCLDPTLSAAPADLIVSSALDESASSLAWFRQVRDNPISTPVFAIVPEHAGEELLRLVAETVTDFATWPLRRGEVRERVGRILVGPRTDVDSVHEKLVEEIGLTQLVGRAPAFLRVMTRLPALARSNRPVLITGETGTGKELCARAIHHLGRRRAFPFIPVDCGAVPDQLFENELFGHERGAFTDAHRRQKGLVGMAEGGTLFLDEIDSLSLMSQAKLLRFLQERTYRPLGGDRFERADINVLAATNQDLDELVREKRFRPDLFFRLSVLRLHMVPLRDRRDDVPLLAQHFLDGLAVEEGISPKRLAPACLMALSRMRWAGNVRELHHVLERAFVAAEGPLILPGHLRAALTEGESLPEPPEPEAGPFRAARARAVAAFERQYVITMLRAHNGNITQAARTAHQDRRAFGRLVKRHNINPRNL